MTVSGYTVGSIAASLLLAQNNLFDGKRPPPAIPVTSDGSFLAEWDSEADVPPCMFYNVSHQYKDGLCSHFSLTRMSSQTQSAATERAMDCATHFETDCILSPEIGLSVPAAFVYDQNTGLKMITAPKIVPLVGHSTETRLVGLSDPTGKRTGKQVRLNNTVQVDYLDLSTKKMATIVMHDSSAYCVQLLRIAFDDACWKNID